MCVKLSLLMTLSFYTEIYEFVYCVFTVPARNPEVKMGAFTSTEKDGDPCVEVTLYWQVNRIRTCVNALVP